MKMKSGLVGLAALMLAGTGLALATAGPAAAQARSGGTGLADLPISAMQNGRVVASTRTDARGGFRFDLAPGAYEVCISGGGGGVSTRQALPDRGPRLPGNGGRAGGQNAVAGGPGGCIPYTAALPNANGTTRTEPIPVAIRQPDGTIIYGLLGMRTNDAPGGGSGPVRQLPDLPAQAATGGVQVATGDLNGDGRADTATGTNPEGRGGRRVDPRIPPPAVAAPRTVTLIGTLSLER